MTRIDRSFGKKHWKSILTVALLAVVMVAFVAQVFTYTREFSDALQEESGNYLAEIVGNTSVNIRNVMLDTQHAVESTGLAFPALTGPALTRGLATLKQRYSFDYVSYVGADGSAISTLPSEEENLSAAPYFKAAMAGESTLEYLPRKIFQSRVIAGMLIAAPAYDPMAEGGAPVGMLVAVKDLRNLISDVNLASFGGKGNTYIIDQTGEIVLNTKRMDYSNLYAALGQVEFAKGYTAQQMMDRLAAHQSGFALYSSFGVDKYIYYQYLDIDDWSLVSVIDKDVLTSKTARLTREMMVAGTAIMIVIPLLLIFAVLSYGISNSHRQAAEAKTAFLANMSHEIRTPMNAIVGISEILLREKLTGQQKNYVLSIVNAGNGLLTIINDILDISKIEAGKFSIVEEEYELESLLQDIVTIIAIRIGDKPIELLVDQDPELPKYLYGDMIRVKQVMLNIIGNATKFTKSGSIKIGIHAKLAGDQMELSIPITDTGIGIQKKDLAGLFENFAQVDTHRNHSLEGTGLGLVISKRLCEMMGGGISVESEYGKGSTFTIHLRQGVPRPEKLLNITDPQQFRVLLLESSDILRDYYTVCMNRMGLRFSLCTNYNEFLAKLTHDSGYTHVLAKPSILQKLTADGHNRADIHYVALLGTRDQAALDGYELTILTPLFTMQLAAVLYNRKGHSYLPKHGGIDVLAIQPLPFVRVLLVDDNEVNLQVANGLMAPYYMQVDCALSGQKAIDMIGEQDYDLVFMDHMMPEMDGVEAVQLIRALPDEKKRTVTIVALTANVTHDAKDLFLASGFDDFLSKPIETIKLNAALKRWLREINDTRAAQNPQLVAEFNQKLADESTRSMVKSIREEFGSSGRVDFPAGLRNLGSHDTYCNILCTYCRTAREKMKVLPQLLDHDLKTFTVEIHGLKGASSGVAANQIARMAAKLEEMGKNGQEDELHQELPGFLHELEETLGEVEQFVAHYGKAPEENPSAPNREQKPGPLSSELLSALNNAFLDFDTEMLKRLLDELKSFSYEARETELIGKLLGCYGQYDFESPLKLIGEYLDQNAER